MATVAIPYLLQNILGSTLYLETAIGTFIATTGARMLGNAIDSAIIGALFGEKSKTPKQKAATTQVQSAITTRKVVYGRSIVSGPYIFANTNSNGTAMHTLVALTDHEIESIEDIIFDDSLFSVTDKHTYVVGEIGVTGTQVNAVTVYNSAYYSSPHATETEIAASSTFRVYVQHFRSQGDGSNLYRIYHNGRDTASKGNIHSWDHVLIEDCATAALNGTYLIPNATHTDVQANSVLIYVPSGTSLVSDGEYECTMKIVYADYAMGSRGFQYQSVNPTLNANFPDEWTTDHRINGVSSIYSIFYAREGKWSGLPNIRPIIKGKRIYDPRSTNVIPDTTTVSNIVISYSSGHTIATFTTAGAHGVTALDELFIQEISTTFADSAAVDHYVKMKGEYTVISAGVSTEFVIYLHPDQDYYGLGAETITISGSALASNFVIAHTEWSDNWALCMRDYITNDKYGLNASIDDIDESNFIAEANECDKIVPMVSQDTNWMESGTGTAADEYDTTKIKYKLASTTLKIYKTNDTDLGGIAVDNDLTLKYGSYNYLDFDNTELTTEQSSLPSSAREILRSIYIETIIPSSNKKYDNTNGTAGNPDDRHPLYDADCPYGYTLIELDSTVSLGTTAAVQILQKKYTINGIIDTQDTPADIIEKMASAALGVMVYTQGVYRVHSAAYNAPTISIDESYLRDNISITSLLPKSEKFNTIKGVFINPSSNWEATEFPVIDNKWLDDNTYLEEDNWDVLTRDLDLPFTINSLYSQRIAKIALEKNRQGIAVTLPCNFKAISVGLWDTIQLSIDKVGWENKIFRVIDVAFAENGFGVDLVLREEESGIYEWSTNEFGHAIIRDPSPDTTLPILYNVSDTVSNFYYDITTNGSLKLSWDTTGSADIKGYEIRYLLNWHTGIGVPPEWDDMDTLFNGANTVSEYVTSKIPKGTHIFAISKVSLDNTYSETPTFISLTTTGNGTPLDTSSNTVSDDFSSSGNLTSGYFNGDYIYPEDTSYTWADLTTWSAWTEWSDWTNQTPFIYRVLGNKLSDNIIYNNHFSVGVDQQSTNLDMYNYISTAEYYKYLDNIKITNINAIDLALYPKYITVSEYDSTNDIVYIAAVSNTSGHMLLKSVDSGVTWERLYTSYTDITTSNIAPIDITINGSTIVVLCTGGDIVYSTDSGSTWSTTNISGSTQTYAIHNDGTTYVVVGGSGDIFYSTTLTSWTASTSGVSSDLVDITKHNSYWIAVGGSDIISTSNLAATWTSEYSGAGWNAVESNGTDCYAVGNVGAVIHTSDGTTWTPIVYNAIKYSDTGVTSTIYPDYHKIVYNSDDDVWKCQAENATGTYFVNFIDTTGRSDFDIQFCDYYRFGDIYVTYNNDVQKGLCYVGNSTYFFGGGNSSFNTQLIRSKLEYEQIIPDDYYYGYIYDIKTIGKPTGSNPYLSYMDISGEILTISESRDNISYSDSTVIELVTGTTSDYYIYPRKGFKNIFDVNITFEGMTTGLWTNTIVDKRSIGGLTNNTISNTIDYIKIRVFKDGTATALSEGTLDIFIRGVA